MTAFFSDSGSVATENIIVHAAFAIDVPDAARNVQFNSIHLFNTGDSWNCLSSLVMHFSAKNQHVIEKPIFIILTLLFETVLLSH